MTRAEPERPQTVPGVLSKIPESGGAGPPISSHSAGNTSTPSPASIHSRRTESVHAQMQAATSPPGMGAMMMSMRIPPTHSTTLPLHTHRHGRLLSMGSQGGGGGGGGQTISLTMPIVSSRPAKIQAEFSEPATNIPPLLTPELRVQLESHLRAYGEALRQLGMLTQRAELMNFSRDWELDAEKNITMISLCKACGRKAHARGMKCRATRTTGGTPEPRCTVCHLPVKKLGRTCLRCTHVSHQSCLRTLPSKIAALCPSGCGCRCAEVGGWFEADRTPPPPHVHRHHSGHGHRHAHSSSSRSTAGLPRR
ncbi:hypothetical protein DL93DRAFT_246295 [Clavulina sp. PMI_390]|nr:hypothetical protein DL93DRAFT_246295 [Clavulina sp. PMI_390]